MSLKLKSPRPCFVYCITPSKTNDVGPCKIGIAINPEKRRSELQSGNPHKLRIANQWPQPNVLTARKFEWMILTNLACHEDIVGEWTPCSANEVMVCAEYLFMNTTAEDLARYKIEPVPVNKEVGDWLK